LTETSTAKLDDQAKCFCIHWPSQLLSSPFLHSLSISFGSILHSIDPGAAGAFTQEHGQQHICNFSKRFLNIAIPSIMQADWGRRFSTTGASFCNSFAMKISMFSSRSHQELPETKLADPSGWENTSFMLTCLASAITVICANSAQSALSTFSLAVPFRSSTFLFMWLESRRPPMFRRDLK